MSIATVQDPPRAPAPKPPAVRPDLAQMDPSDLVGAHLTGDPRAFGELVRRFQSRLLNFVYRMIGDRDRAEDLVQEAFVRVHRHLHRFDRSKKFSTWVYTIASNLAKNELRNRSRSPLVFHQTLRDGRDDSSRPLEFEDNRMRPDDLYHKRQLRELVEGTVAQLTPHHREVFVLRELQGRTYEDIAEITECNLGTVKSRLNRARNSFADMIGPQLD